MKCLQFGGLLDFYGEVFSPRRRPHRAESGKRLFCRGKRFGTRFGTSLCASGSDRRTAVDLATG
jgi:hypothetical protein